jgi:signal transduction histidine kinase
MDRWVITLYRPSGNRANPGGKGKTSGTGRGDGLLTPPTMQRFMLRARLPTSGGEPPDVKSGAICHSATAGRQSGPGWDGAAPGAPAIRSSLPVTYRGALRDYLVHPDEATLRPAYELGRAALSAGLGNFDVIRLHHQALTDGALPDNEPAAAVHFAPALQAFLLEALAPFAAAQRNLSSGRERLEHRNRVLTERNAVLVSNNAQLGEEMGLHQETEVALRQNQERYRQLFQQARAMEEHLRELSAQVLAAQEAERKRVSCGLHDEVSQALTAVTVAIAILKKQAGPDAAFQRDVAAAEHLLTQSMETVHRVARELRPAMLDHLGVQAALHAHVTNFTRQTGIRTELIGHPDLARLDGPRGEALFRVAQEALNNVRKHAKATIAKIEFTAADGILGMEIADNGRGFDVAGKPGTDRTGRLGLLGMQERVRHVNGSLAIESTPGRGTRLCVRIPFDQKPPPAVRPGSGGAERTFAMAST